MDKVGGVGEVDALSLGLGEKFAEGAQGFGVRMANGDCLAFLASIFGGELQLAANGTEFRNIIEKRDVAEGAGNTSGLGGIVSDGGGDRAAVDKEEIVIVENGHELGHEASVGSGEGALMVIDTDRVRHAGEHGIQHGGNFSGRHARAKFLGFRGFVGEGFHGEMEHDLVTATMGFLGNLRGTRMIGEDGEGQGIVQGENGIDGSGITRDIVENDG